MTDNKRGVILKKLIIKSLTIGVNMEDQRLHSLIFKMITSNKLHKMAIEKAVDETGLRRNKHHMLMHLAKHGAFSSQKEIAERLGITPAAVTLTLSSLEKDGLITRKCGKDSRFNEITITNKGLGLVSRSREHFQKVDRLAFEGISEREVEVLESCLDKMIENLLKETEEKI